MALGCREGQVQMAPESWHNQGRMSGILEEHLLLVTLAPCHTVGLVLCRRKAKDAIPVIREPVLSLEQKTSAKRSQLRVAWAKGQAVTALSGSMRQS